MTHPVPQYVPSGGETALFRKADQANLPVMLVGPTGCGKTRLVEYMATELCRSLVTVTCHEDLTTADLVGRFLVKGGDVTWIDGPLTRAVRDGAICYLDEVIEARRDTLAALHSLADHRRTLHLERANEELSAPEEFLLVCSYNPRHRGAFKELRASLRQRFVTIELDYLSPEDEAKVVAAESGVDIDTAVRLVGYAGSLRSAIDAGVREVPSTRLLVNGAQLIALGASEAEALEAALLRPLQVSGGMEIALRELLRAAGPSQDVSIDLQS